MNKKLYVIEHYYDVDGGFGDCVPNREVIAITEDKAKAEEYVKRYNNPQPYEKPYCTMYCHELGVKEIVAEELDLDKDPFENSRFNESIKHFLERKANGEIEDDEDDEEDEDWGEW